MFGRYSGSFRLLCSYVFFLMLIFNSKVRRARPRFALLGFLALASTASAAVPFEFTAALRDSSGRVPPNGTTVHGTVEITDCVSSPITLYSEDFETTCGEDGLIRLHVGNLPEFDSICWDGPRFLRFEAFHPREQQGAGGGQGDGAVPVQEEMFHSGTFELAAAPVAMTSDSADALVSRSPDGSLWELTVSNSGTLSWRLIEGLTPPNHAPEHLYFIGTALNWQVAQALEMARDGKYAWTITRRLSPGEIFKFTPSQSWDNERDWSASTCSTSSPNPLREFGNTPAFEGAEGEYELKVDFATYTLTITRK